jgi:hypothetical protein
MRSHALGFSHDERYVFLYVFEAHLGGFGTCLRHILVILGI